MSARAPSNHHVLEALDHVLADWQATDAFAYAVAESVSHFGYAQADVEAQLQHIAVRCSADAMRRVVTRELGPDPDWTRAPSSVLVLASGRVPGLSVEGIAAALAVGARAIVRPSRDDTVLHHFVGSVRAIEPDLLAQIEVVGGGGDAPWSRCEAAIVFGSDETIALAREHLPAAAAQRVAGYGSRQGIAVVADSATEDVSWATRLADDVLTFRQSGCMSPSWLYVLGDPDRAQELADIVGRELALGRARHVESGVADDVHQRRATDADVLNAIAAGMAPDASVLYAGDARVTVVRVPDEAALIAHARQLGSMLQTAVVAADPAERTRICDLLATVGVSRVCEPGQAHFPDPLWPQDGIGRVAPLLG